MFTDLPVRSTRDRYLILRSLPALSGIGDDGLVVLAEHTRRRSFAPGEAIFREEEALDAVHFVYGGLARVTRGGAFVQNIAAPGGLGFLAMLGGRGDTTTATAVEPTTTLELPARVLTSALEEHHDFLRNSLRLVATGLLSRRSGLPANPDRPPDVAEGTWRDEDLTLVQRMIEVTRTPFFAHANIDAIISLARMTKEIRLEPGTLLWNIGDPPAFILRIACGVARCTSTEGRTVDVGAGYTLGGLDSFSNRPRAFAAASRTRMIVARIDRDDFLANLETHPQVGIGMLRMLTRTLSDA